MILFPTKNSLNIYKQRYLERGNSIDFTNKVIDTYDLRYNQFKSASKKEILLDGDITLEDWLIKNNYTLIK